MSRRAACLALFGGWVLFFAGVIFTTRVPFERDLLLTEIPLRQFMTERLLSGHLPGWYPYEMLGVPFAGSMVASPFHPQVLLHLLLSAAVAVKWRLLLAYLFGLAGAYRLGRLAGSSRVAAVTAAYAFAFSGYAISVNNNLPYLIPLMTAPWMIGAVWRLARRDDARDIASVAIWWALIFLGGDAQLFLECGVIGVALLVGSSWAALARLALAGLIATALAGAELLPALALRDQYERATWASDLGSLRVWAVTPFRFADFLLPHFIPESGRIVLGEALSGRVGFFAATLFLGAIVVVLAALGLMDPRPKRVVFVLVALVGFWLATGEGGLLLPLLAQLIPWFAKFRYPEKYVAVVLLGLIPLVAAGCDRTLNRPGTAGVIAIAGAGGLWLLRAGAASTVTGWFRLTGVAELRDKAMVVLTQNVVSGLSASALTLSTLALAMFVIAWRARADVVLPLLVLGELVAGNGGRIPLIARDVMDDPGRLIQNAVALQVANEPPLRVVSAQPERELLGMAPEERIAETRVFVFANDAGRWHIAPFELNSPAEEWRVTDLFFGPKALPNDLWTSWFGVCLRVASASAPTRPGEQLVVRKGEHALVRQWCVPRARLTDALPVPDYTSAKRRMNAGLEEHQVVWEGGPAISGASGSVRWMRGDPDELDLEINASAPSGLAVAEAFARGWAATVDGEATPIYPTDGAIRGIVVPAGKHTVTMSYRPPGLMPGLVLSFVGCLACLLLRRCGRRRAARR